MSLECFKSVLPPNHILTDTLDKHPFLVEWRGRFSQDCLGILLPQTPQEVSECLKIAAKNNIWIVPQGGNTGLVGGQIPTGSQPQVVLSLKKMKKIRDISPDDFAITVDAGVTLLELQQIAHDHNRLFPLSLASEGSATIGGLIATNAGGTAVLKYGSMRDLVLGLEVVLSNGDILSDTHYLRKNNTGFDTKYLFIASEGLHGIITGASLKLFSKPKSEITCLIGVQSPQNAIQILALLREATGDNIIEFELMPQIGMEFVLKHHAQTNPFDTFYPWYCLVTASSGFDEHILRSHLLGAMESVLNQNIAQDIVVAENITQSQKLRTLRMLLSQAQKHEGASIKHDVSVPVRRIPDLIDKGTAAIQKIMPNVRPCPFGHAGDGNIHFNFSQPIGMDKTEFMAFEPLFNDIIFGIVHDLGGCFSAEHGIGTLRTKQMHQYRTLPEITLRQTIKNALDNRHILNPNKGL